MASNSNTDSLPIVVIVDDREENLLAFEIALRPVPCQTVRCSSGRQALDYLRDHEAAAILLDIQMPEMNGLDAAIKIRELETSKTTPILFITAIDRDEEYARRAYSLGAIDFIYKPADPYALRTKVSFFVEMFRKTKELERKTILLEEGAAAERTFILEHALDAVIATDEENCVTFWNEHAVRLFGWTKEEMIGHDMTDIIIPPEFRAGHRAGVKRFLETRVAKIQNQRIEIPGLRKSGERFLMELTVSSVKTDNGFRFYSFMRDISAQKLAQKQIAESEQELRTLANSIPQMAWMADENGAVFWYNDRWFEYTGTTREEMMGWGWQSVMEPTFLAGVTTIFKQSIIDEVPSTMEIPIRSKSGEIRWFLTRWLPLKDETGKVLRWFGTNTDIHEEKRLREDQEFRADLVGTLNATTDLRQLTATATKAVAEYLSTTRCFITEVNGRKAKVHADYSKNVPSLSGEYDLMTFGPEMVKAWEEGNVVEVTDVTKDVRTSASAESHLSLGIHSFITAPLVRAGRLVGAMNIANQSPRQWTKREVELFVLVAETVWAGFERVRLLDELKMTSRRSEFLAAASSILSSSLDVPKILTSLSDLTIPDFADWSSIRILSPGGELKQVAVSHQDPEKVKWGWELQKKFPPDPNSPSGPFQVIRSGKPEMINDISDELIRSTIKNKEQQDLVLSLGFRAYICVPLVTRNQVVGTLTLVTTDQSGRRYSDEDLKLATELGVRAGIAIENARLYHDAQAINRLKDEFLANLSHELRTPMNVIQGHAEILECDVEKMTPEEIVSSVEAISRNARTQMGIINDLLDVSSIITGKVAYRPEALDPVKTVEEIVVSLSPAAQAKGVAIEFDQKAAPSSVMGDSVRLHQIIWNLLSNAIKFTDSGGKVRIEIAADKTNWSVVVSDTGKGIDPEFLPYVFDRFRQEDASTTRKYGGLGLGLSIVRHLTELHGGQVRAESPGLGQGSKFVVTLPLRPAEESTPQSPNEKPASPSNSDALTLAGIRVLLVDDSQDNRELIKRLLTKAGAEVVDVDGAKQARTKLTEFQPDVIISDVGMPDESGIEFMRKLRSSGDESVREIPAIALTAYVREEERLATKTAGFQEHVGKPVSAPQLLAAIRRLTR